MIRILASHTDPPEFAALFFAECDSEGRSIEVQWSGNGNDPRVQERIEVMEGAFGSGPGIYGSYPVLLAGLKNNRLHPKHTVDDLNAAGDMYGHVWRDSDFAP